MKLQKYVISIISLLFLNACFHKPQVNLKYLEGQWILSAVDIDISKKIIDGSSQTAYFQNISYDSVENQIRINTNNSTQNIPYFLQVTFENDGNLIFLCYYNKEKYAFDSYWFFVNKQNNKKPVKLITSQSLAYKVLSVEEYTITELSKEKLVLSVDKNFEYTDENNKTISKTVKGDIKFISNR